MMEVLFEFGLFLGKALVLFILVAGIIMLILAAAAKAKHKPSMEVENLNDRFLDLKNLLKSVLLDKKELKKLLKSEKKTRKKTKVSKRAFVIEFEGDIHASQVRELRDEVTSIISAAEKGDEVIAVVDSRGGTVHGYGLAAAQLLRIKDSGIKLTVCVDKIAASGGYMMAATADKILAAPFAIIGSIGVLAQVPNLHRLLKKNNVDYEEYTAGDYKKTVSIFGEITEKGRKKFTDQLEDTHVLFKEFIAKLRPNVDLGRVATGEYWFATRAKEFGLVDEIMTSDEYILSLSETTKLYKIKVNPKKNLMDKLSEGVARTSEGVLTRIITRLESSKLP